MPLRHDRPQPWPANASSNGSRRIGGVAERRRRAIDQQRQRRIVRRLAIVGKTTGLRCGSHCHRHRDRGAKCRRAVDQLRHRADDRRQGNRSDGRRRRGGSSRRRHQGRRCRRSRRREPRLTPTDEDRQGAPGQCGSQSRLRPGCDRDLLLRLRLFARFGQASILVYYALWLPLVAGRLSPACSATTAISSGSSPSRVFACLSVFWSAAPGVTARAGTAVSATHVVCALIAARTIDIRTLTLGALAGVALVLALFAGIRQLPSTIRSTAPTASSAPSIEEPARLLRLARHLSSPIAALFMLGERGLWRLLALVCLGLLSAYSLFASQSATSVIATAATLCVMIGLRLILLFAARQERPAAVRHRRGARRRCSPASMPAGSISLLGAFGKDSTLTGRTYLWSAGHRGGSCREPGLRRRLLGLLGPGLLRSRAALAGILHRPRAAASISTTPTSRRLVELGLVGMALISLVIFRVLPAI